MWYYFPMLNEGFEGHVEGAWKGEVYAPKVTDHRQLELADKPFQGGAEIKNAKDKITSIIIELGHSQFTPEAKAAKKAEAENLLRRLPSDSDTERMKNALRNA